MSEPEITYRYFHLPHQFSNFLFEPRRCDICGFIRGIYDMTLSGESICGIAIEISAPSPLSRRGPTWSAPP